MPVDLSASSPTSKPQHARRNERLLASGALAGLLWVCLQGILELNGPSCPSTRLVGVPCAGCGMTRSLRATLSGAFESILAFHPAAPLVAAVMLLHAGVLLVSLVHPAIYQAPHVRPVLRGSRWLAFVVVVIVGLVRALLVAGRAMQWDTTQGLVW